MTSTAASARPAAPDRADPLDADARRLAVGLHLGGHLGDLVVEPGPPDPGEELALDDLCPRVEGHAATVVGGERLDIGGAGHHALHEVGVDVGPGPTVGQRDRGRREPMATGVAAAPHAHPRVAGRQLHVEERAPPTAARVATAVPAHQHLGRSLADHAGPVALVAIGRVEQLAEQVGHGVALDAVVDAAEAVRSHPAVVDDAELAVGGVARRGARPSSRAPAGRRPRSASSGTSLTSAGHGSGHSTRRSWSKAPAEPIGSTPCAAGPRRAPELGVAGVGLEVGRFDSAHAPPRLRGDGVLGPMGE